MNQTTTTKIDRKQLWYVRAEGVADDTWDAVKGVLPQGCTDALAACLLCVWQHAAMPQFTMLAGASAAAKVGGGCCPRREEGRVQWGDWRRCRMQLRLPAACCWCVTPVSTRGGVSRALGSARPVAPLFSWVGGAERRRNRSLATPGRPRHDDVSACTRTSSSTRGNAGLLGQAYRLRVQQLSLGSSVSVPVGCSSPARR